MSVERIGEYLWVLVLMGFLGGCVPLRPYHTDLASGAAFASATPPQSPMAPTPCYKSQRHKENNACVRFVEYDDFGNLFNRAQLDDTVQAARAVAERGGIIVVYVHGWDHNADGGDPDLESFHGAMQNAQTLDHKFGDTRTVLGIYVGWRGKSVSIPGLSKITFWERKTTAQSIGDGAVFELFRKLANHRETFPNSRLVVIGHSFGAAVTYSSVSHSIVDQIIDDDPYSTGQKADSTYNRSKRWDMVVLVNPAFEAMQLRPQFDLARSRKYQPNQLPHLIMITSQADWATRILFPLGRFFRSTLNEYTDANSSDMYRTAIGHYIPFVTHQLIVKDDCNKFLKGAAAPVAAEKLGTVVEEKNVCFDDDRALLPDPVTKQDAHPTLLTRCDSPGDCAQVAGEHCMITPRHMPILNIRTTGEVMTGHNDIWNPTMQGLLVQLLLSIVERPVPALQPSSAPERQRSPLLPAPQMKKAASCDAALHSGSPTWTRTRDLRINSPSLYRLSYQGMEAAL